MGKSIQTAEARQEILNRLGKLSENSPRKWGTMNAASMLAHLSAQLRIGLGDVKADSEYPEGIQKLVKFFGLNFPWIRNLQTPKPMKVNETASFEVERNSFILWLEKFVSVPKERNYKPHPFLGKLNQDEWGRLAYKHIDHHLRQFGV